MTWKQTRNKHSLLALGAQTTFKKASEIVPKSMKIRFLTPTCASCCSHGPPRWPRVPKWRHQACQNDMSWAPKITESVPNLQLCLKEVTLKLTCRNQRPSTYFSREKWPRSKHPKTRSKGAGGSGRSWWKRLFILICTESTRAQKPLFCASV